MTRNHTVWHYETFTHLGHTATMCGRDSDGFPMTYWVTIDDDDEEYDLRDYAEKPEPEHRGNLAAWMAWRKAAAIRLIERVKIDRSDASVL
jgi:hypothetical protein